MNRVDWIRWRNGIVLSFVVLNQQREMLGFITVGRTRIGEKNLVKAVERCLVVVFRCDGLTMHLIHTSTAFQILNQWQTVQQTLPQNLLNSRKTWQMFLQNQRVQFPQNLIRLRTF